jgi:hypothetical protein
VQALTAPPRENLTEAQVRALLRADVLSVDAGLERMSATLQPLEDLSADLEDGTVERNMDAVIHGTCKLRLTRRLSWGTDLVRPYIVLSDGVVSARFNQGVYCLTTPERVARDEVETYDVEGYDRVYLLNREVGDSYEVAAGTPYLTAVQSVIAAAGLTGVLLDGSAGGSVLPSLRVWPLIPTDQAQSGTYTYLNIVNDLLSAINYRGIYCDENGVFRSEPYAQPSARPVEYAFDALEPRTIVGETRTLVEDQWKARNRWVFVQQNIAGDPPPAPVEGAGIYTVVNQSDGPSSIDARGLTWTRVEKLDAADQAALVAQGNQIVAQDRRVTRTFKVTTGPFPAAGHYDVFTFADSALGVSVKVQAQQWTHDLFGSDTSWTWEAV